MTSVKSVQAANAVVTRWTFGDGTTNPTDGSGTLNFIGGNSTTGTFVVGKDYDSVSNPNDKAYQIAKFPSQGTGNLTTGLEFSTSTLGYTNVVLTFAHQHNSYAPNRLAVQYSINGGNYITHTFVIAGAASTYFDETIDFGTALNNKQNVKFRLVAAFAEGTSAYAQTSGSTYNAISSNIKFDNIYVRADAAAAATNTPTRTLTPTPTNTVTATPTNTATASPTARATTIAGGQCTDYTSSTAQDIPDTTFADDESGIYTFGILNSAINVPTNFQIANLDVVNLNLSHTYMSDLKVELISPQGVVAMLFSTVGFANTQGFVGTTFDDQAGSPITMGTPPFTGSYKPTGPFYVFNTLNSIGQWRLRVTDKQEHNSGTLLSWTLRLCDDGGPTPTQTPIPTNTPIGGPTSTPETPVATDTPAGPTATATATGPAVTPTPDVPIDPDNGNIYLSVDAQPDSGQNFDFVLYKRDGFPLDDANPDDGDDAKKAKVIVVPPGGPYQYNVSIPPEWTVTQISCTGEGLWEPDVSLNQVKITVDAGSLVACNFVVAYTSPNTPTSTPTGPTHTPTSTSGGSGNTPTRTPTSASGGPTSTPMGGGNATATATPTTDPNKGRLDLIVDAQPDSGQNFSFFSSFGDFLLDDANPSDNDAVGNKKTFQLTPGGPYAFSVSMPAEWKLQAINCAGTGTATPKVSSNTVEVTLAKGNALTCTFKVAYTSPNTPTSTPVPPTATATPTGSGSNGTATPTPTSDGREQNDGTIFLPLVSR